ncbi:hypothetical protein QVD17_05237 [Tagetes erecta]|uniref:Uncharacterized protein n=1 Tax=Tagetes erecta TaxID=13708 RepID=A0AAD8LEN3_TARER|nr:hypothetical protein QVD17_05237 [Tagetes erecta]
MTTILFLTHRGHIYRVIWEAEGMTKKMHYYCSPPLSYLLRRHLYLSSPLWSRFLDPTFSVLLLAFHLRLRSELWMTLACLWKSTQFLVQF